MLRKFTYSYYNLCWIDSLPSKQILITAGPLTDSTAQNKGLLGKPYADQKVRTELSATAASRMLPGRKAHPPTLSPAARSLKSALGLLGKAPNQVPPVIKGLVTPTLP